MQRILELKLLSAFSPICQTLLNENIPWGTKLENECLSHYSELLVVYLNNVVIGFVTFDFIDNSHLQINSLHFRNMIKDQTFASFWLSRYLKRFLRNKCYMQLLLRH